jgi:hypothetical protein
MQRMSASMTAALAAITAAGGEAHPEGGGYWMDQRQRRLQFQQEDGATCAVLTNTVMALHTRGHLIQIPNSGNRNVCAFRVAQ